MKESYIEGLANRNDPESCGGVRKGPAEALTGERAGRVLSRERISLRGADVVGRSGRLHPERRQRETFRNPARSETPCMYGRTLLGNREIPCPPAAPEADGPFPAAGRVGKSKDASR